MLEDKAILSLLNTKVRYLFSEDNSVRKSEETNPEINWNIKLDLPLSIYSPLGVGGSSNHLQVRSWAMKRWIEWDKKCELIFYEDLPYAAKIESPKTSEDQIISKLQPSCGKIVKQLEPLSEEQIVRKIRLCRTYFSQTNYSELIGKYAKVRGRSTSTGFAEMFYRVV